MGLLRTHQLSGWGTKVKGPKKKPKLTKQQLADKAAMEALAAKWAKAPLFGGKYKRSSREEVAMSHLNGKGITAGPSYKPCAEPDEHRPKSLVTPGGSTAKKKVPQYTGTKMLGVATMHKSNQVPVFSTEEADDIAHMRR